MPRKRINPNVKLPSVEDVAHIPYDPETGVFLSIKTGAPLQLPKNPKKYLTITALGWVYSAHRIAFLKVHGWCPDFVDHIDRNKHNNAISNLRPATGSQSLANRGPRLGKDSCKSKYVGVTSNTTNGRYTYVAQTTGGLIGTFYTEEEAADAYNKKVLELHGEYAVLNELPERIAINPLPTKAATGFKGVVINRHGKPTMFINGNNMGSYATTMEAALEYDLAAQRLGYHPCEYNFPPKTLPLKTLVEKYQGFNIKNKRKLTNGVRP